MWFGKSMRTKINADVLKQRADEKYTQDALFHTLLGLFDVQTQEYDKDMDMLK
jgi:lipid A ethanolaminephosphotransferase